MTFPSEIILFRVLVYWYQEQFEALFSVVSTVVYKLSLREQYKCFQKDKYKFIEFLSPIITSEYLSRPCIIEFST